MNTRQLAMLLMLGTLSPGSHATTMTLQEVLQQIAAQYQPLQTALLGEHKAQLEQGRIAATLGWQYAANGGLIHDVSMFGTPTDQLVLGANASRVLPDGAQLTARANYRYENADYAFSPLLPNPSHNTSVDVSYRQPLLGNVSQANYRQGLVTATATEHLAAAQTAALQLGTANQAIELFHGIAMVRTHLNNLDLALERGRRLLDYINRNSRLGLAENHDRLQVEALLQGLQAEHQAMAVQLSQQQNALNRLMGRPADVDISPQLPTGVTLSDSDVETVQSEVLARHPQLMILKARLEMTDALIERRRAARDDRLDGIITVGGRSLNGDSALGNRNQQDAAYMLQLEYRSQADKQGLDAELAQARYDHLELADQTATLEQDLRYQIQGLLQQTALIHTALATLATRLETEQQKLQDGTGRWKQGRITTQQLLLLEADLSAAQSAINQQRIDLARRQSQLELLRGRLTLANTASSGASRP